MTDILLATGFADQAAVDELVRAEIRYFRSRDMQVWRCEAPGPHGPRASLAFEFRDRPDLDGIARALSRSHPSLRFAWKREQEPHVVTRTFVAGKAGGDTVTAGTLEALPEGWRRLEEIYGTF